VLKIVDTAADADADSSGSSSSSSDTVVVCNSSSGGGASLQQVTHQTVCKCILQKYIVHVIGVCFTVFTISASCLMTCTDVSGSLDCSQVLLTVTSKLLQYRSVFTSTNLTGCKQQFYIPIYIVSSHHCAYTTTSCITIHQQAASSSRGGACGVCALAGRCPRAAPLTEAEFEAAVRKLSRTQGLATGRKSALVQALRSDMYRR
jgi:hypothetical protein